MAPAPIRPKSYFSRLRRAEIGIHHRISGKYLNPYASEMAWREDHRRVPNGAQSSAIAAAALEHPHEPRLARILATERGGVMVEKHVISALIENRARVAGELSK